MLIHFITSRELSTVPDGATVLGVEATRPDTIAQCNAGNIDPQHTGGQPDLAAIEAAVTYDLGRITADEVWLVTDRPDLDSIGAMAVLAIRVADPDGKIGWLASQQNRLRVVADADKATGGPWKPRELPARQNPWPEAKAVSDRADLAAIAAFVADFRVPMEKRVDGMESWLIAGVEPDGYRERVEAERLEMIRALEDGTITVRMAGTYKCPVAVVTSTHRAATTVGYAHAPVVVAMNPEFRWQGGEPHTKITVCQWAPGYIDLRSAVADLNQADPVAAQGNTWGGSPTIVGSPQGISPGLSSDQVITVVRRHLTS